MRINKELSQKREEYAYQQFSQDPPRSVSDVQADFKNPQNDLGGFEMSAKRIYELQNMAQSKTPLPTKVYTRRRKDGTKGPKTPGPVIGGIVADPDAPIPLLQKFGGAVRQIGTTTLKMLRWGNGNKK